MLTPQPGLQPSMGVIILSDNLMKAIAQNNVYLQKILHVIISKVSRAPRTLAMQSLASQGKEIPHRIPAWASSLKTHAKRGAHSYGNGKSEC